MCSDSQQRSLRIADVMAACTTKGYKPDQIDACLEEYEELNVWQVNQAHTKLTFVWVRSMTE